MKQSGVLIRSIFFTFLVLAACSRGGITERQATRQARENATAEAGAIATAQADLLILLSKACAGEAVVGTAPYAVEDGFHPMVLFREEDIYIYSEYGYIPTGDNFGFAPENWWPYSLAEAQLVACSMRQEAVAVEVCRYDGPSITRYVYEMKVQIFAVLTGDLIAENTFTGVAPRACAATENESLTELHGEGVDTAQIQNWLSEFVGTR